MNKKKSLSSVGPRKAPKQERSRQTYQIILQGATEIIRRDGLKKLSTNRVAEESKVSIGSLYQYFPSKQAIIAALIDQVFETELNRVTELIHGLSPDLGPRAIARIFFSQYYELREEDFELRKTLIEAVPNVDRAGNAMEFHCKMAEMIINYMRSHFEVPDTDLKTEIFILQYIIKGIALSSVDHKLKELEKDHVVAEWAEILIGILRIPESKRGPRN